MGRGLQLLDLLSVINGNMGVLLFPIFSSQYRSAFAAILRRVSTLSMEEFFQLKMPFMAPSKVLIQLSSMFT